MVFDIVWVCGFPSCLSILQTFQQVEDGEESEYEQAEDEKSPSVKSFSQSSLYRRKSTRGSSFAGSEGEREEKEKLRDVTDRAEEVSCGVTSFGGLCSWRQHLYLK